MVGNGAVEQTLLQSAEMVRQGRLLREAVLRVGTVEVVTGEYLDEGQMYIVDTTQKTEFYEAEDNGRLLIVHKGLAEDAESIREALEAVLAEAD